MSQIDTSGMEGLAAKIGPDFVLNWFNYNWPWVGLVPAFIFLLLLFGTDKLRNRKELSRWRDPVWLSWLVVPVYLIHQAEEYGIDLTGQTFAFPNTMCRNLGLPSYPECPIPLTFYVAVNLSLFWIAAPLTALLSYKHSLVGLGLYGIIIINGIVHCLPFVLGLGYNPGAFTAIILFFPLFFWVAFSCFGEKGLSRKGLILIIISGILCHAILMGSAKLFLNNFIKSTQLILIQLGNAFLTLLITWIADSRGEARKTPKTHQE